MRDMVRVESPWCDLQACAGRQTAHVGIGDAIIAADWGEVKGAGDVALLCEQTNATSLELLLHKLR